MLVDRKALLLPLVATLIAIPTSPLFWDGDVNAYLHADGACRDQKHQWHRSGGFYPIYQQHPAWSDLGIDAERQLLPIGILFNVPLYFLLFYTILVWLRLLREIGRRILRRRQAADPQPTV